MSTPNRIVLPPGQYQDAVPSGYTLVITSDGQYLERPAGPRSLNDLITPSGPVTPSIPSLPVSGWLTTIAKILGVVILLATTVVGVELAIKHWPHNPAPTPTPTPTPTPPNPPWIPPNPPAPPTPTPLGSEQFGQMLDERLAKMVSPNADVVARLDAILTKLSSPAATPAPAVQYAQPATQTYTYPTTSQVYYYPATGQACYVTRGR